MEIGSDDSVIVFTSKKDYLNVLSKLNNLHDICDDIINLMKEGIKKNIVLPKIITQKLIEQFNEFKKNKSYKNSNVKFRLGFDFNKEIENIVIPEI